MNYDLSNITLTNFQEVAGSDTAIIVEVAETKLYENGVKTDKHGGYRYTVVLPSKKFASLSIKTEEEKPSVTPEQLAEAGNCIYAVPNNFSAKIYRSGESFALSCKADGFTLKEV